MLFRSVGGEDTDAKWVASSGNTFIADVFNGLNILRQKGIRSEERRVGKECRSRWSPYH